MLSIVRILLNEQGQSTSDIVFKITTCLGEQL